MSLLSLIKIMILLSLTATAGAQEHSAFNAMLKKELNLSKKQEERLAKINSPEKSHMRFCYKEMEKAEGSFEEVLFSANASEQEIRDKFQELQKAQEEYAKARIDKIIAIRSILTKEQQEKFLKILEQKKKGSKQDK